MLHDYRLLLFSGLTILMWGLWGFFGKLALDRKMAPMTIFLTEVFISAFCALPVLLTVLRRNQSASLPFSWNIFGLVSGAGLALGLLFYYLALERGQVSIVVPLTAIYPLVSVLLGLLILHERLTRSQWLGAVLVIAGAVLLLSSPLAKAPYEDVRALEAEASTSTLEVALR